MGRENRYFKVGGLRFLQALTPRERCSRFIVTNPSGPLSRGGKGGGGKGQMRLRLPWERICAQYGFGFFAPEKSKFVSSTASDRKGFVKGESVPLDRVLPTFARTKVGPRRAGVLTMPLQKAPRRRQAR